VLELTQQQLSTLERLGARGFTFIAFPMYEKYVGVKKDYCAALLAPVADGGFQIYGEPCYLLNGHLTVRIKRDGSEWIQWKKEKIEATFDRLEELARFSATLSQSLLPGS
jgi:hypothetical protein